MPRKLVAAALAAACLACGGRVDMTPAPVPADKADYIGHWQGPSVDLVISPDGMLAYENTGPSTSGSMTAPIVEWKEDGFRAGVSFLTMDFHVDAPPHEDAGAWKMTVDGTEMTRLEEGAALPAEDTDLPMVLMPPG